MVSCTWDPPASWFGLAFVGQDDSIRQLNGPETRVLAVVGGYRRRWVSGGPGLA